MSVFFLLCVDLEIYGIGDRDGDGWDLHSEPKETKKRYSPYFYGRWDRMRWDGRKDRNVITI